jgi:hypothetical protein
MRKLGVQNRYVYSVLDTLELTNDRGEVSKYVHVRNPWAEEHYEGPSLDLTVLAESELAQVPSSFAENDGEYLIEEAEFKGYFPIFEISKKFDGEVFESSKQVTSPSHLAMHTFIVTPQESGIHYLSVDTWYHRMYRLGCVSGLSVFKFVVRDTENKEIMSKALYHDQQGTKSIEVDLVAHRDYRVIVQANWHHAMQPKSKVYREFTLMV